MKALNLSRWFVGFVVVAMVAIGVGWFVSRGGKRNGENTPPVSEVSEIRLELPEGAPEPSVKPQATIVNNLAELPTPARASLVAAGKFQPAGATFPQGLKVTWPLHEQRSAGTALWIVVLDEERKEWVNTGNKATVAADGKSATGIVYHFSTIGLQDGPPSPSEAKSQVAELPGQKELRQVRPAREHEARQAEAAQARLAAIAWKASARLFDFRPEDELARLTSEASRVPLDAARQLRSAADRNALAQLQATTKPEKPNPLAPDPLTALKNSYDQIEFMLTEAKRTVSEGPLAQQLAAELKKATTEQEQAMTDGSPAGLQRFLDATDNRAKVDAKIKELERDKTSLEKSLKALRYFKVAVELGESAASDKPGSSFGVLKGVVSGVEAYNKDAFSQAPKLYQAKMFETEKALRAFNSAVASGKSRGVIGDPRGYVVPGMLGQKRESLALAEGKEFEAEGAFKHQAQIKEWLGNTKKVLSGVQKAYEAYNDVYKKFEALEKALDEAGPRLDVRSRHFAEYCTAVSSVIKSVVGNLESLLGGASLVPGTAATGPLSLYTQAVIKMLLPMADVFEELGKFVVTAQRIKDKFTQGIQQADDTPDGLMYPVETFWVLKLTVYYIDDNNYRVPGAKQSDPMVRLDAKKYQTFIRVVSSVTSLRGRNFTQAQLSEFARLIAEGADKFEIEYQWWDPQVDVGFSKIKREFTLEQLTSDDGRATIDEEVGAMAQRYANISRALTGDDAAVTRTVWFLDKFMSAFNRVRGTDEVNLGEKSEIPLNKLLSIDDKENRDADRIYRKYNDTWRRLESLWREVYLSPLPSAIFGAVQQHEAKTARKEGDPSTYSPLEERLIRLRDGIRARPEATARILTLLADNPAWGQYRFNMVYATSGLTSKNVVSRYFKVKKGDGEWVELNPSKAEDMPTGAAIEGVWELPMSAAFRPGHLTVRGIIEVDGKQVATVQHEVNFDVAFQILDFNHFPRKLESEGKAHFTLTAYVEEGFMSGKVPDIQITLDGPGGESNTVKAVIDPKDLVWLNGHTLFVKGTIPKLPKWPTSTKRTKVTASVSFGNVQTAEQAYVEVTEADAGSPTPPAPVVRAPANGKPTGYQFKSVKRVEIGGEQGNAEIVVLNKEVTGGFEGHTGDEAFSIQVALQCKGGIVPQKTIAHFTIQSGSYTMHAWAYSMDGKPGCILSVPFRLEGQTATITAEAGDLRASRSVRIVNAGTEKFRRKALADLDVGFEKGVAHMNSAIEAERKKIKEEEERVSKLGSDESDKIARVGWEKSIYLHKYTIKKIELGIAMAKNNHAGNKAYIAGEWDAAPAVAKARQEFGPMLLKLELETVDGLEPYDLKFTELVARGVAVPLEQQLAGVRKNSEERRKSLKQAAEKGELRLGDLPMNAGSVGFNIEVLYFFRGIGNIADEKAMRRIRGDWDGVIRDTREQQAKYPNNNYGSALKDLYLKAGRPQDAAEAHLSEFPPDERDQRRKYCIKDDLYSFPWWPRGESK